MRKLHVVKLTQEQRDELLELTRKGTLQARMLRRANILLLSDEGMKDKDIAAAMKCSNATVERTRKCFVQSGLPAALKEKPRPGAQPRLDTRGEAHLIALACSNPPEGRVKWTMQMLADRMVELKIVDALSDETVRRTLKKTSSSPGRRNSGASPP